MISYIMTRISWRSKKQNSWSNCRKNV